MAIETEAENTLFDLDHKSLNAYWVNPEQPLIIPNNPLHWRAHELQLLLDILKKQASKNPAQFNSKNYIEALNEYTKAVQQIKEGKTAHEVFEPTTVAGDTTSGEDLLGDQTPSSLGVGVPANNPFAG